MADAEVIKSQLLCQLSYAPSTGKSSARHFLIVTFLIFLIIAHNASFNGLGSEPRRINLECIDDPYAKIRLVEALPPAAIFSWP
jgi:hypothetical protein